MKQIFHTQKNTYITPSRPTEMKKKLLLCKRLENYNKWQISEYIYIVTVPRGFSTCSSAGNIAVHLGLGESWQQAPAQKKFNDSTGAQKCSIVRIRSCNGPKRLVSQFNQLLNSLNQDPKKIPNFCYSGLCLRNRMDPDPGGIFFLNKNRKNASKLLIIAI